MKRKFLSKTKYLIFFFVLINVLKLNSEDFPLKSNPLNESELLIESRSQKTDLENLIFYAEGEVVITSFEKEFIAKSDKAIFYKLNGKIRLEGNAEVITSDSSKIKAGEIVYYLKENKFEAISDLNKRVRTKFFFNDKKIINQPKGK